MGIRGSVGVQQIVAVTAAACLVGSGAAAGAGAAAAPAAEGEWSTPTSLVSVSSTGVQTWSRSSGSPAISATGRYVAFLSGAPDLVNGDSNEATDVFVRDRSKGVTRRVSLGPDGVEANDGSIGPAISADGRYVAFVSHASNLVAGDTNGVDDVFVRDRSTGVTRLVSLGLGGAQADGDSKYPALSADGRYVAFSSSASNLVAGDTNSDFDVFVRDRSTETTQRVSLGRDGAEATKGSFSATISARGRYVAFISEASNLVPRDTNTVGDVFVRNLSTGTTRRASVGPRGAQANGSSYHPEISGDGRHVTFDSAASNLVGGDSRGKDDVFVRHAITHATRLVSVGLRDVEANADSGDPSISANGRYVTFGSYASNLVAGDTNGAADVFLHDRRD